jgi:hypothetical protein
MNPVDLNENITFMNMAPLSLKILFTIFKKSTNSSPIRLRSLFHDMSFSIPLHAIEKAKVALSHHFD